MVILCYNSSGVAILESSFFKMESFIDASLRAVSVQISASALKDLFESLGVDSPEDVRELVEEDLTGIMKKVQARKLLAHWGINKELSNRYVKFFSVFIHL